MDGLPDPPFPCLSCSIDNLEARPIYVMWGFVLQDMFSDGRFDPTEETSGIAGETFWKSLCLMTGERELWRILTPGQHP